MRINWIFLASLLGSVAVILGAVGSHMTAGEPTARSFYETALRYHMFSLLPLIVSGYLINRAGGQNTIANIAAVLTFLGMILFCGSLYYLALTGTGLGFYITPLGGLFLIAGWLTLATASLKNTLL